MTDEDWQIFRMLCAEITTLKERLFRLSVGLADPAPYDFPPIGFQRTKAARAYGKAELRALFDEAWGDARTKGGPVRGMPRPLRLVTFVPTPGMTMGPDWQCAQCGARTCDHGIYRQPLPDEQPGIRGPTLECSACRSTEFKRLA